MTSCKFQWLRERTRHIKGVVGLIAAGPDRPRGGHFRSYRIVARPDLMFTVGQFRSYRIVARLNLMLNVGQFHSYLIVARPDPVFTVGQFRSYRIVARPDLMFIVGHFRSYRIVAGRTRVHWWSVPFISYCG